MFDPESPTNRDPRWVSALASFCDAVIRPYHRGEVRGVERLPEGRALYVGNHNASVATPDTWILLGVVHRERGVGAIPHGLGHDAVMTNPVTGPVLARLGGIRANQESAERILRSNQKVMVYPGGDIEAMRPFRERDRIKFGGRRGYVRLALRTGSPIVPIDAAGAHSSFIVLDDLPWLARLIRADRWARMKVWPAIISFPWGLTFGPSTPYIPFPTRILIEILPPITFSRTGEKAARDERYVAACAAEVEATMQGALLRLSEERRQRSLRRRLKARLAGIPSEPSAASPTRVR